MTNQSNFQTTSIQTNTLVKRMLAGAAIGLFLISLFLLTVREPNPEWGDLWMIRPLIIVPLAGAMGGLCHSLIMQFHQQFNIHKTLAILISLVVFVIGLFMGFVLGLDGTLWN